MSSQLFSEAIQQEVNTTSELLGELQELWPAGIDLSVGLTSSYYFFPYFFLDAFPSLRPADIRPLALAGRFLANSIFVHDKLMDAATVDQVVKRDTVRIMAMQFEAYKLLYRLFPADAQFWLRFREYLAHYANACAEEQAFANGDKGWAEYTEETSRQIAIGKNGVAKVITAGLCELAQAHDLLARLSQAVDSFNIACQLWDDFKDWKEDLCAGIPSLILTRVIKERPANKSQEEMVKLTKSLAREIYYGGHASYVMERAIEALNRADAIKEVAADLPWYSATAKLRQRCQGILEDIERIVGSNLERVRSQPKFSLTLTDAEEPWKQMAWHGLSYIISQWHQGFGEARDIMKYPREFGFSSKQEYYYGDIFQRALIADVLCDTDELLQGALQPVIEYEARYLLNSRCATSLGGWSYFPDLPELPPDADDLAQVMQVLLRSGHREEVVKYCERPLQVVLADNGHEDGSFETWIVPAGERTVEQARHAQLVELIWGSGPDSEVVANLLIALFLYDRERFAEVIERGINFIESQQRADGSWATRWYFGPYYGIYVCLRVLAACRPHAVAVEKALTFVRDHQNEDGGWGLPGSDPLSTALALLALASVQQCSGELADQERATRAQAYLLSHMEADKAWQNCKLIYVGCGEFHGSRTITTNYVLKAAVAWHRLTANTCSALLPITRRLQLTNNEMAQNGAVCGGD